jgi:hypothetical protein
VNVVSGQLDKEQLKQLVEPEKIEDIWETRKDVIAYSHFRSAVELGLTVGLNDLPFERAMVFSWIKGEIDGRKTRV